MVFPQFWHTRTTEGNDGPPPILIVLEWSSDKSRRTSPSPRVKFLVRQTEHAAMLGTRSVMALIIRCESSTWVTPAG